MIFLLAASIGGVSWAVIFLIVALVLFALAALNVPSSRVSLGWAGLFCLTLGLVLG